MELLNSWNRKLRNMCVSLYVNFTSKEKSAHRACIIDMHSAILGEKEMY